MDGIRGNGRSSCLPNPVIFFVFFVLPVTNISGFDINLKQLMLVQVCETLVDPQTRKREIAALDEAMDELKTNTGFVTRNEEETIHGKAGSIQVVPAWRFLLSLKETG